MLTASSKIIEGGEQEVTVSLNGSISIGESYECTVAYEEPNYFKLMPHTRVRLLNEWFRRYDFEGLEQEEPQSISFEIALTDPRFKIFGLIPLQSSELDAVPPVFDQRWDRGVMRISWKENVRKQSRGADIFVLYKAMWPWEKIPQWIRALFPFVPKPS